MSLVLIDSSVYIEWDRSQLGVMAGLLFFTECFEVAVCGVIRCEVGGGLRDASLRRSVNGIWQTLVFLPTDNRIWEDSEDLLWSLERQGLRIPLADAVIASCALRANAIVYTRDPHFDRIPGLRVAHRLSEL